MTAAYPIDTGVWLQHAWHNRLQSLLLLVVMAAFLALLGWLLWGGTACSRLYRSA